MMSAGAFTRTVYAPSANTRGDSVNSGAPDVRRSACTAMTTDGSSSFSGDIMSSTTRLSSSPAGSSTRKVVGEGPPVSTVRLLPSLHSKMGTVETVPPLPPVVLTVLWSTGTLSVPSARFAVQQTKESSQPSASVATRSVHASAARQMPDEPDDMSRQVVPRAVVEPTLGLELGLKVEPPLTCWPVSVVPCEAKATTAVTRSTSAPPLNETTVRGVVAARRDSAN
mmetsp:Transcript_9717/g.30827  ORF Transcript_9717/g.30827 Transcript_9717/m.30827 type:complete len:225 (+) Transcript_9717:1096-1770(+)